MNQINNNEIKIGIYSGSFNPPGIHHRKIVKTVLNYVDQLIISPCGSKHRKDKIFPKDIYRKEIIKLAFCNLDNLIIDYDSLDNDIFISNFELKQKYILLLSKKRDYNIIFYHIVGSDLTCLYKNNKSIIELFWENGTHLWDNDNFIVIPRKSFELNHLPKHSILLQNEISGSSTCIRNNIENSTDLLPEVKKYILENKLY